MNVLSLSNLFSNLRELTRFLEGAEGIVKCSSSSILEFHVGKGSRSAR